MMKCRLLTPAEFTAADEARLHLARTRLDGKQGASIYEITGPGVMWSAPWLHDPHDPQDKIRREQALRRIATGQACFMLSRFYWLDHSRHRSPLVVICPNGREWCVDQKSSNGEGWRVTGNAPTIEVSPSIDVPGYHGWLGTSGMAPGVFSDDLNKRGPNGIVQ